jgi:hypothetical protein
MGIQSAAAAAANRRKLEKALPDRCTVKRVSPIDDGHGGWTDGETDFATGIPCRVDKDATMDRELIVAGRQTAESSFVVSLSTVASRWPNDVVDVKASDRLVVTGDGAGTYEPIGDGGPVTDEYLRTVRCTKTE